MTNALTINTNTVSNVTYLPLPTKSKSNDTTPPKYTNQRGHQPVSPIKDKDDIEKVKSYFLSKPERYQGQNIRDYTLFVLQLNSALRAGDLLHLHISDLTVFDYKQIIIKEQKTRRCTKPARVITIPDEVQNVVKNYINTIEYVHEDDYLFSSRSMNRKKPQSDEKYPNCTNQPMSVKAYWEIIKKAQNDLELKYNIATHTARKTFGYQKLMAHRNDAMFLTVLQDVYGHSAPSVTTHYVGIDAEVIAQVYEEDVL